MVRIAFILLCHKNPDAVIEQARMLTSEGDAIAIHYDLSSPADEYQRIQTELADVPGVVFPKKRVKGGWGEWSLVEGTIVALQAAYEAFPDATHFYFISGDCMPVKPRAYMARYLSENDKDFVQHNDFFESDWIKTGLKEDRLRYRHFFNERERKPLFYASLNFQRRFGLSRKLPNDVKIFIGSQWCVLRRSTTEAILSFIRGRKDIIRFFRTTWIPDETFFQSLVMHLVPRDEVENRTLTFLAFSDYGLPFVLYDDHYELLTSQSFLFARKVSSSAMGLKERLRSLFNQPFDQMETADTAETLYAYMTSRGRFGRRFSRRFWERGGQIGRGQEVLIVACKKWHVAKRFIDRCKGIQAPESLGYVFEEDDDSLPDLGGIETKKQKRGRHRRGFLKLLFEIHNTERLMICLDPSNVETIRDIASDDCALRLLEIRCDVNDDYMLGHAERVGLLRSRTDRTVARPLVQALHRQFRDESEALRDLRLPHFYCVDQAADVSLNTEAISRFLGVPAPQAERIARDPALFAD
ncbi:MAG: DUF5928 domain-containing protein [Pseudomonadota bacterium]